MAFETPRITAIKNQMQQAYDNKVLALVEELPKAYYLKAAYNAKREAEEKELKAHHADLKVKIKRVQDMAILLNRKLQWLAECEFITMKQTECAMAHDWYAMLELLRVLPDDYDVQFNEDQSVCQISIKDD